MKFCARWPIKDKTGIPRERRKHDLSYCDVEMETGNW